ncbi:phosphotransferase-like protein [Actinokineospora sp.]|uniref:phosphotransferase-like protein n=1 Tax=Actinokineospora sp. TaxID=1872133 RepID=UPI003D6C670E
MARWGSGPSSGRCRPRGSLGWPRWCGRGLGSSLAWAQAEVVHEGVHYDFEVDTTATEALECARLIAAHVR